MTNPGDALHELERVFRARMDRLDATDAQLEELVRAQAQAQARIDDGIAEIRNRIERLERAAQEKP